MSGRDVDPATLPVDDEVDGALDELRMLTVCRCDPAWTERGLHAPHCLAYMRGEIEMLAAALGRDAITL